MIDIGARKIMRQVAVWGALFAALGTAAAQPQPQPKFTRIFGSDTIQIQMPALSPDGRWIVFFREMGNETFNLWVVPASGGAPIQLTSGSYADVFPSWFPSGDRIAFTSTRPSPPGEQKEFVMTIPFDARTGHSAGPAQQVSLEKARYPVVSPDGRWIAFTAGARLMVVPSAGGTARTVAQVDGPVLKGEWSPDGRELYFMAGSRGSNDYRLMRVSADSGQAQPLWTTPRMTLALNATARRALTLSEVTPSGSRVAHVFTFEGRPVATIPLHRGMFAISFTGDGTSILTQVLDVAAPIRVVPVAGGPSRSLTQAREYDWPDSWSADATRLAVGTRTNGHYALLDLPVDGGPGAEIVPPPEAGFSGMLSRDRSHLFFVVADTVTDRKSLRVRRLSDGRTRVIAPDFLGNRPLSVVGPGGFPYGGAEFLYFERRGDRLELRSCAPEGEPRLLRSFPASFVVERNGFGVHGTRIAWAEEVGDSSALLVAEGRNGTPRRIAVVKGRLVFPVWSPDGRWIAAGYQPSGAKTPYSVFVVGVSSAGSSSAPPRIVETGLRYGWDLAWLFDNRAVTVVGNGGPKNEADVWLISLREGDQPVNLTRDDPSEMVEYSLSPDGKYIAYPAQIPRGSSIWRIDLRR